MVITNKIPAKNMMFRINNFDLIRLFAAFQVVLHHSNTHFGLTKENCLFLKLTAAFPGVPIFFFISGYLISRSYEQTYSVRAYVKSRFLRIYPALWVCFF